MIHRELFLPCCKNTMRETINVPVPEGYEPQSMPVKEENRLRAEDIIIENITQEDMPAIVRFRLPSP